MLVLAFSRLTRSIFVPAPWAASCKTCSSSIWAYSSSVPGKAFASVHATTLHLQKSTTRLCRTEFYENLSATYLEKDSNSRDLTGDFPSICARATRLITNHGPIGEYRARFFPNKANSCPCNNAQLETRHDIPWECPLYSQYYLVGYVLSEIVYFLK